MTLAVAVVSADGVVVAADSRMTWMPPGGVQRVLSDSTKKVFEVSGCAVATYGWAFLDNRNIAGHAAEFAQVRGKDPKPPLEVATEFAEHFDEIVLRNAAAQQITIPPGGVAMGFIVGGIENGVGCTYEVVLPGKNVMKCHDAATNAGAIWRGQTDVVRRLVKGADLDLLAGYADQDGLRTNFDALKPSVDKLEYGIPTRLRPMRSDTWLFS